MLATLGSVYASTLRFEQDFRVKQGTYRRSKVRVTDDWDFFNRQRWFLGLADARQIVETWRQDYNQARPHSALGYQTPVEFAQGMIMTAVALLD
jgi:transposase InsO family protein